jgi:hypothetical protein
LARPVDHDSFEPLDLVFLTSSSFNIMQFFSNRNIELSLATTLVTGFS